MIPSVRPARLVAEHECRLEPPRPAPPDQPVALGHAPDEREEEREGVLGGRAREDVRGVRDDDSALACVLQVDVVEPDRVVRHDPELRPGAVEERGIHAHGRDRDETQRALGPGEQLEAPRELLLHAIRDPGGHEDGRLHDEDHAGSAGDDAYIFRCKVTTTVRIPPMLRDQVEGQRQVLGEGETVGQVLEDVIARYPSLRANLFDEGDLTPFVNVYVGRDDVRTREGLDTRVDGNAVILLPAMAGGCGARVLAESRSGD